MFRNYSWCGTGHTQFGDRMFYTPRRNLLEGKVYLSISWAGFKALASPPPTPTPAKKIEIK
jgi:hypothetical protein